MKKTKIEQRIENAVNAFFDDENLVENNSLTFADSANLLRENTSKSFTEKADVFVKILKRTFLFLPGVFVLFFMSVAFTGFLILRPHPGGENHLYLGILITLVSAFMTFLGLGDWRNPKHLFIPLSIVSLSLILGIIGSITHGVDSFPNFINYYAANFLPLAFILPFLAKGWIDKTDEGTD